jgi:hypothetical protein
MHTLRNTKKRVYIVLQCLFKSATKNLHLKQHDLPPVLNIGQWKGDTRELRLYRYCLMMTKNSGRNMSYTDVLRSGVVFRATCETRAARHLSLRNRMCVQLPHGPRGSVVG